MSLLEIKQTAFGKWLLAQPREAASLHLLACLASGGEIAWELWESVHGEASVGGDTLDIASDIIAKLEAS